MYSLGPGAVLLGGFLEGADQDEGALALVEGPGELLAVSLVPLEVEDIVHDLEGYPQL